MAFTKYIIPALSVASTAYAACSVKDTTTISSPAEVTTCSTFVGNIAVATGAASAGTVDFGQLEKIDGDFEYKGDSSVQTIMFNSLEEVTGDFTYSNMSQLSQSGLSSLKTVGGKFVVEGVSLNSLGLTAGLKEVGTVTIINTGIDSLQGLSNVSKIEGLTISDNLNLGQISLSVAEVGMINIGSGQQANGGQEASFPNLENVDSLVVRNCSSVDFTSLTNVTNDFRLIGNTFDSFAAKNLTKVGALIINNNGNLRNISFPILEEINSGNATLQIANNTKLDSISGLPKLSIVTGDVTLRGNFSKFDVPSITRIRGALNVDTASTSFDCSSADDLKKSNAVRGKEVCRKGSAAQLGGNSDGTSTSDAAEESSSSFATPLEIPATFMSGFTVLAGVLSMFM